MKQSRPLPSPGTVCRFNKCGAPAIYYTSPIHAHDFPGCASCLDRLARAKGGVVGPEAWRPEYERALRAAGVQHDSDGVVLDDDGGGRRRRRKKPADVPDDPGAQKFPRLQRERFLTAEEKDELAKQAAWRLEQKERRAKETEAMIALLPVEHSRAEGEPPHSPLDRLVILDERTARGEKLCSVTRPNGSEFVALRRSFDGNGDGFGERTYVLLSVWYRRGVGKLWRSKGCAVERAELRALAAVCTAEADRLDAEDALSPGKGERPERALASSDNRGEP